MGIIVEAAGQLWANLKLLLALILTFVVVVVGYEFISKAAEAIVGAAAGAAAGICISQFSWEEEKTTGTVAKAVIAVSGGIAGTAASMLRSLVATHSLIGSAIVGALAGAAIVLLARQILEFIIDSIQFFIKHWFPVAVASVVLAVVQLFNWVKDIVKWVIDKLKSVMNQLKQIVDKIKELAKGLVKAAKTIFDIVASVVGSGFAAIALIAGSLALAPAVASGLAAIITALVTSLAGLAAIGIAAIAIQAILGMHQRGQLQPQVEKLKPLVNTVGVWQFCLFLLFLFLFLWFLLGSRRK